MPCGSWQPSWFRHQPADHVLQATALVHEAYLRVNHLQEEAWQDKAHFLAVMGKAMRSILVDYARRRSAQKRGGDWARVTLSGVVGMEHEPVDFLALTEALEFLEALNPRQAQIVELRFFGGLSVEEVATYLDLSPTTVKLDWRMARSYLSQKLQAGGDG